MNLDLGQQYLQAWVPLARFPSWIPALAMEVQQPREGPFTQTTRLYSKD